MLTEASLTEVSNKEKKTVDMGGGVACTVQKSAQVFNFKSEWRTEA